MKQPSERGIIGAWAYEARAEASMSVEQVAAAVTARGQAVTPSTIRGIESGNKKPGARLLKLLATVLESVPPGAHASEPPPELATALADLARSTQAMADELAALRDERAKLADRVTDLEMTVAALAAPAVAGTAGGAAPRAPQATAR